VDSPTSAPIPAQAPARRGPSTINILLGLALFVAFGGVAFAGGRMTAPAATSAGGFARNGGQGGAGFGGGTGGTGGTGGSGGTGGFGAGGLGALGSGLTIQGTVSNVTNGQLTLHLDSGQDLLISLDASTTYHQQGQASATDVQVGRKVLVEVQGFGRGTRPDSSAGPGSGGGQAAPPSFVPGTPIQLGPARDVTIAGQ